MKVGDLVIYNSPEWNHWLGIIIRQIPGTDECMQVLWNHQNNVITSNPKRDLELVNESR